MPAREDRDEQLLEDRLLAHDDLAQLALELVESVLEPLDGGEVVVLQRFGRCIVAHAGDLLVRQSSRALSCVVAFRPYVPRSVPDPSFPQGPDPPAARPPGPRPGSRRSRHFGHARREEEPLARSSPVSRRRKTKGKPSRLRSTWRDGRGTPARNAGQRERPTRFGAEQRLAPARSRRRRTPLRSFRSLTQ